MSRGLAALGALVAAASLAGTVSAAGGRDVVASYCSPSGDVCYGIVIRRGHTFELTTAARYFARYRLCVRRVGSARPERCGNYPVFRGRFGTWYSTVRLARQFPGLGPGSYRVAWRLGSQPLGPALRFRR